MPFMKKSITLPEEAARDLDRVATECSLPVSCVVQLALSHPDKYALLVGGDEAIISRKIKPLGKNIVDNLTKVLEEKKLEEYEGTEDEKGLGDQILAWINEP
jgi:hypothetical protein